MYSALGVVAMLLPLCNLAAAAEPRAAEKPCVKLPGFVERAIKKHAREIKGAEYCEYRSLTKGDLNSDGAEDIVIAYNIEGACYEDRGSAGSCGNDHSTFLTAFLRHGSGFRQIHPIEVGGRGEREIVSLRLAGGRIEADTLDYDPSDPQCCPSKKGRAIFFLSGNRLAEAKR